MIRRYYAVVGNLASTADQLEPLLAPGVRVVEHPNAITPNGAVHGRDEILAGLKAGRALLSDQNFELHEILVLGSREAVRATWSATVGVSRGPLSAGTPLRAEIASFLTVEDGCIVDHETFDCYPPFPTT